MTLKLVIFGASIMVHLVATTLSNDTKKGLFSNPPKKFCSDFGPTNTNTNHTKDYQTSYDTPQNFSKHITVDKV